MAIFKVYELVKIKRFRKNIQIYRIIIDGKDIHGFGLFRNFISLGKHKNLKICFHST